MSTNTKPLTVVERLLAQRATQRATWDPSEEQKEKMQQQEPSEAQVRKLLSYGKTQDEIAELSKWDASEIIEAEEARRGTPGSLSKRQHSALVNCGYLPDDVKILSFYEASELLERTFAGRPKR